MLVVLVAETITDQSAVGLVSVNAVLLGSRPGHQLGRLVVLSTELVKVGNDAFLPEGSVFLGGAVERFERRLVRGHGTFSQRRWGFAWALSWVTARSIPIGQDVPTFE